MFDLEVDGLGEMNGSGWGYCASGLNGFQWMVDGGTVGQIDGIWTSSRRRARHHIWSQSVLRTFATPSTSFLDKPTVAEAVSPTASTVGLRMDAWTDEQAGLDG